MLKQCLSTTAYVKMKQEDYIGGETIPQREPKYSSNCPQFDMQLAQQSHERVLIYSPDTDVYNIGLSLIHTHPDTDLFCSILWGEIPIPWKAVRNDPHLATLPQNELGNTVEPPNKGHFGSRAFVLYSEVVLWWEVQANMQFIAPQDLIYLDSMY